MCEQVNKQEWRRTWAGKRGVDVRAAGLAGERVDAVDHAGWARGLGDVDDVDGGVGRRPGRALDVERAAADVVDGLVVDGYG